MVIGIGAQDHKSDECAENEDHHFVQDQVGRKEDRLRISRKDKRDKYIARVETLDDFDDNSKPRWGFEACKRPKDACIARNPGRTRKAQTLLMSQ